MLINFLWLKVFAAFNDLHNLKILLCQCKMSFKIDSLTCMKYIKKQPRKYQPLPLSVGNNIQTQILKSGDQKKMSAWRDLKSSFHRYLPGGAYCVSCQERLQNKMLFWGLNFKCWSWPPNNQLMFSFVTLWFC